MATSDLDVFPNEILSIVLGHLHQPFHYHNHAAALVYGSEIVPATTEAWNPVGLQRVCRRWLAIARPMFYVQVDVPVWDVEAMELLAEAANAPSRSHPVTYIPKTLILAGYAQDKEGQDWIAEYLWRITRRNESLLGVAPKRAKLNEVVITVAGFRKNSAMSPFKATSTVYVLVGPSTISAISSIFSEISRAWTASSSSDAKRGQPPPGPVWPGRVKGDATITFRCQSDVSHARDALKNILAVFDKGLYVPRVRFDLPFTLSPTLLDVGCPTLKSILQHSSLPVGRDFIFKHTGATKTLIFGTQSTSDATALRARIDALGTLAVAVEVVVLDI